MQIHRRAWLNRLKLAGAIALATVAVLRFGHSDPPPTASPGQKPELALQTLDGRALDAHALAGHVVVLNFWATWCPACRAELPDLQRFADRHRGDCVDLLGISDESAAAVGGFARAHGLRYPMAVSGGALEEQLGIEVIPTSVILDPEGRIAGRIEGAVTPAQLERLVGPLAPRVSC